MNIFGLQCNGPAESNVKNIQSKVDISGLGCLVGLYFDAVNSNDSEVMARID